MLLAALILAAEDVSSAEGQIVNTLIAGGPAGVFVLMLLLRWKVLPAYVFEDAKKEWERERGDLQRDLAESKAVNVETQKVYVEQVIPTLTRVFDELQTVKERNSG